MSIKRTFYLLVSIAITTFSLQLYAQPAPDCPAPLVIGAFDSAASSAGRSMLVQGIALFDAKNFKQAERALQAALFAGLSEPIERALAHKYLAYVYCEQSEWGRCESEFDAAFAANANFSLNEYEAQAAPWRNTYAAAKTRWTVRCGDSVSTSTLAQSGASRSLTDSLDRNSLSLRNTMGERSQSLATSEDARGVYSKGDSQRRQPKMGGFNVKLHVKPWALIYIDGRRVGVTPPMVNMSLPLGRRTIELVNPGFESIRKSIQVSDGRTELVTHDFESR